MFRQVRFQCATCGEGFVDWHDDDWERAPVFCVNCGEPIVAGEPVESLSGAEQSRYEAASESALGVLRADGRSFRDTLPGLRSAPPPALSDEPPESSSAAQTGPRESAASGSSRAASEAPRISAAAWTARHPRLAPLSALLIGFAVGIPFALLTVDPILDVLQPTRAAHRQQNERLAEVANAIDEGQLEQAHQLLDRIAVRPGDTDHRATALRARLALAFILANRRSDAGREIATFAQQPPALPPLADLQRVFAAVFPPESRTAAASTAAASTAAASTAAPLPRPVESAAATPNKPVVTRRELLTFARDRQHRAQLDLAERLYAEVLRVHPNDAEARCGLAEVQLLRGGVADGAQLFARALNDNPNYAPAWIGLADTDWLSGRPERAACRYQAVIDRFPSDSYPPYIAQRVTQVSNSGAIVQAARSNGSAATACGD